MANHEYLIKSKLESIVGNYSYFEIWFDNTTINAEFGSMYERPDINFAKLKQISNEFKTDDIKFSDGSASHSGCDTCDYGSLYTVQLTIKNYTI